VETCFLRWLTVVRHNVQPRAKDPIAFRLLGEREAIPARPQPRGLPVDARPVCLVHTRLEDQPIAVHKRPEFDRKPEAVCETSFSRHMG
jgi:hypothetical protein